MFRLQTYCHGAWRDEPWADEEPKKLDDAIEDAEALARVYGPSRVLNERSAVLWSSPDDATPEQIAIGEQRDHEGT
jgi:hypothetical protein